MKILLLRPNHTEHGTHAENHEDEFKYRRTGESLALGYLAASLEKDGHIVKILDGVLDNLSNSDIINFINESDFDIIGFSTNVYIELNNNLNIINNCEKLKNIFVVIGGHVASFVDKEIIKENENINCIMRYEGEEIFCELARAIENGDDWRKIDSITYFDKKVIRNNPRINVNINLDELPFPRRDTITKLQNKESLVNVCTSRGCYGICSFCSVKAFYNHKKSRWHGRSPDNVVQEIENIVKEYGFKNFLFVDDNYVGPGINGINRIDKIADLLIEKNLNIKYATNFRATDVIRCEKILPKLKKSGLRYVFLGTESGNQKQLDFFIKKTTVEQNEKAVNLLDKNGIGITQGVILFDYRISFEEIIENLDYLARTKGVNAGKFNSRLLIYHGTELYEKVSNLNKYSFYEPIDIPFENKLVEKVYNIIDDTLSWGAEWCNDIEDLYWDCAFKYDIEVPESLEQFNFDINKKIIKYIKDIIYCIKNNISYDDVNTNMQKWVINNYTEVQNFIKEFNNNHK